MIPKVTPIEKKGSLYKKAKYYEIIIRARRSEK
jgi:hypothetical protein